MKKPNSIGLICLLFLSLNGLLRADTISLQDGRVLKNVKVSIGREMIMIHFRSGRILQTPVRNLKFLKKEPVNWKIIKPNPPKKENSRERQKATEKNGSSNASTEASTGKSAVILQSLIPLWSGLNLTDRKTVGFSLSALEFLALYSLIPYLRKPRYLRDTPAYRLLAVDMFTRIAEEPTPVNQQQFLLFLWIDQADRPVSVTGNNYIAFEDFSYKRSVRFGVFAAAIALDVAITWIFQEIDAPGAGSVGLSFLPPATGTGGNGSLSISWNIRF